MSIFSKVYELSLTRTYVSRWGMAQAVRELIQNALDSDSPFVYSFTQNGDTTSLSLVSEFTTLLPQTLLLGSTSKADSKDSIGSFGEGYKIALLVLTRLGHDVEIRNGDLLWKPRFRHNAKFGEELLVIDETPLNDKTNKGLTFIVHGLSDEDVVQVRASCLHMQDNIGQVHETHHGEILLERPGLLYVGGLFICQTDLKYGYNIKPQFLKLERDRQTVDGYDLKVTTREMWYATQRYDDIAKMIAEEVPDVAYARYASPEMVREACFRLFIEKNPGAVVAESQEQLRRLIEQGMTKVIVVNGAMYNAVRQAPSYIARPNVRVATPAERMEAWFAKAKYKMGNEHKDTFRALLAESKGWTLKS